MQKMYKVKKPTPMIVFIWNKLKDLNHKDFFFFFKLPAVLGQLLLWFLILWYKAWSVR